MSSDTWTSTKFKYRLLFVSIIPPHYAHSFNIFNAVFAREHEKIREPDKYFIKYSYLIFAWFYHLKTITLDTYPKNSEIKLDKLPIRFNVLPTKRSYYTLTKAPMAHKKNSKEQFCFKYYFILAVFKGYALKNHKATSCDAALVLISIIRTLFPFFSTNLLLIKTSTLSFTYSDRRFFNYFWFSKLTLS